MQYWQDLKTGQSYQTDTLTLTKSDILEFAAEFDPQPYHLNSEAGEESIFGGLCASGWHVCAMMMRLLTDTFKEQQIALMGVAGVPAMRWKIPVFAEDSLSGKIKIFDLQEESQHETVGSVICTIDVINQKNEPVIELTTTLMVSKYPELRANV